MHYSWRETYGKDSTHFDASPFHAPIEIRKSILIEVTYPNFYYSPQMKRSQYNYIKTSISLFNIIYVYQEHNLYSTYRKCSMKRLQLQNDAQIRIDKNQYRTMHV